MHTYRLRELRKANHLTQQELAELLQCTQQNYSKYETGIVSLSAELLVALADYYHTSVDYILGRVDTP